MGRLPRHSGASNPLTKPDPSCGAVPAPAIFPPGLPSRNPGNGIDPLRTQERSPARPRPARDPIALQRGKGGSEK